VKVSHRGVFGGSDPIALAIGRMTVAVRRAHAAAMQVELL
jgi:ferrous iron transport protein A